MGGRSKTTIDFGGRNTSAQTFLANVMIGEIYLHFKSVVMLIEVITELSVQLMF